MVVPGRWSVPRAPLAVTLTIALAAGAVSGVAAHRLVGGAGEVRADTAIAIPAASDVDDLSVDTPAPDPSGPRERLRAYDCPGSDPVGALGHLDRILITAVHVDDEGWIRTRDPLAPDQVWWVRADFVDPDMDLSQLPRLPCADELIGLDEWAAEIEALWDAALAEEVAELDDEPVDVTTTTEPPPTTSPTPAEPGTTLPAPAEPAPPAPGATAPSATTAPTTAPVTAAPSTTSPTTSTSTSTTTTTTTTTTVPAVVTWSGVNRQHAVIRENFAGGCDTSLPISSSISATASHPSGIASVQFRTRVGGGAWSGWQTVATGSGAASGQIGPFPADTAPPNATVSVSWEFRATPNQGGASTITSTANNAVTLTWCSLG